jgi:hypothetical protein
MVGMRNDNDRKPDETAIDISRSVAGSNDGQGEKQDEVTKLVRARAGWRRVMFQPWVVAAVVALVWILVRHEYTFQAHGDGASWGVELKPRGR